MADVASIANLLRGSDREFFDLFERAGANIVRAAELLDEWGAATPTLVILADEEAAAGKSFRNLARVEVMPVSDAGVADVIRAASLLVSQAALPELVTRAADPAARGRATGEEDAA